LKDQAKNFPFLGCFCGLKRALLISYSSVFCDLYSNDVLNTSLFISVFPAPLIFQPSFAGVLLFPSTPNKKTTQSVSGFHGVPKLIANYCGLSAINF
ncbi:hypothetical protein, partial [Vibrio sp. V07_P2A8T137]|uniref:hypothetical protein n=1 Tax=Vibrio sp. V07_P2A8T137 TaxID=1938662 RepID=UPI001C3C561C